MSQEIREAMLGLYEESGGDPAACEFCGEPLDEKRPWVRGLDGAGAHNACLPRGTRDDDEVPSTRGGTR